MKIILVFLLLFIITPVFAEVFFVPEWSEFCPKKFQNISITRWHYTASGRYWSERKKKFEQRLEKCNSLSENLREACYKNLRDLENQATVNYNDNKTSSTLRYMMINSIF